MKAMTEYDYERTQGIPIRMDEDTDRERASEALHGGRMFCQLPHVRVWEPGTLRYAALVLAMPSEPDRPTLLPESAFDWPIYNAVHALRYVVPDWPRPAFPKG